MGRGCSNNGCRPAYWAAPLWSRLWWGCFLSPILASGNSELFPEQVHSCLPSGWQQGMGNCYYARKWNRLKLATFYHAFLWKLGAFNRLQFRSYRRQTLPAWLWCRWGGRCRVLLPRLPASVSLCCISIFQVTWWSFQCALTPEWKLCTLRATPQVLSLCITLEHAILSFNVQKGIFFDVQYFFLLIKMIKMKDKGPIIFYQWPNVLPEFHVLNLELSHSVWQNCPW